MKSTRSPWVDLPMDLPRSLHRKAAIAAARDGVSLNEWVNMALSYHVGLTTARIFIVVTPPKRASGKRTRKKAGKA